MFLFVLHLILVTKIVSTSGRSEPDRNCVPNCLNEFEQSLAKENVPVNMQSVASLSEAKLLNVCRIYEWDSECLDTCVPSELQEAARLTMNPIAQICTTHYETVRNHTYCFEAIEEELRICGYRCGWGEESIDQNSALAIALVNDDQQDAFDVMDVICTQKLCHLDCEAEILANSRACSNTTGFNQTSEQIDELARRLASENIGQLTTNWPILDANNTQFPESCRRLQKETPVNNDTKLSKTAHICSLSGAILTIFFALHAFVV